MCCNSNAFFSKKWLIFQFEKLITFSIFDIYNPNWLAYSLKNLEKKSMIKSFVFGLNFEKEIILKSFRKKFNFFLEIQTKNHNSESYNFFLNTQKSMLIKFEVSILKNEQVINFWSWKYTFLRKMRLNLQHTMPVRWKFENWSGRNFFIQIQIHSVKTGWKYIPKASSKYNMTWK